MTAIINLGLGPRKGSPHSLMHAVAANLLHATKWCALMGIVPQIVWRQTEAEPTLVFAFPLSVGPAIGAAAVLDSAMQRQTMHGLLDGTDQDCLAYYHPYHRTGGFIGTNQPDTFDPKLFVMPNGDSAFNYAKYNGIPRRDYGPKD